MAVDGKLSKMLILAFSDSEAMERGGLLEADESFETLINPESYTLEYKIKFSDEGQGHGTSGTQLKYEYTEPSELSFEFLFDNTGIIDGKPRKSVAEDIATFKEMMIGFKGDAHEPRHFKLVWGEASIFKGRVTALGITYKLFDADGSPIRAVVKVTFKSSIEEERRAASEDRQSPDLTKEHQVRSGETLPQLSYLHYGDPSYYLQLAEVNGLDNFRDLKPGTRLRFPPVSNTRGAA